MNNSQALLLAISGPSGVGKGTVINVLRLLLERSWLSVSATSREIRGKEVDGKDYFFLSKEVFQKKIEQGEILEYDEFCGEYYGTPKEPVMQHLEAGETVFFDITVKGALALKKNFPKTVTIFLAPPSFAELRKRLESRGTESEEKILKRLTKAPLEFAEAKNFDYIVINDKFKDCLIQILSIITAEGCKTCCRDKFLDNLIKEVDSSLL